MSESLAGCENCLTRQEGKEGECFGPDIPWTTVGEKWGCQYSSKAR